MSLTCAACALVFSRVWFFHKVKGNICINPLGMKFRVPSTSVKIAALVYGLDVGRTTTRAMKAPGLLAFV